MSIGIMLYLLLDIIVDQYFPAVDQLADQVETVEQFLFAGETKQAPPTLALLSLKKIFLQFRRIVAPERDVLNVLTNRDNPLFGPSLLPYFRDVSDHLLRLADTLDLYRDQLANTMDANLSLTSNALNQTMRTLTVMSIILMSTTLVASIYGMNFNPEVSPLNMPELNWPYGYFLALAIMGTIPLLLAFYFKRRRWF